MFNYENLKKVFLFNVEITVLLGDCQKKKNENVSEIISWVVKNNNSGHLCPHIPRPPKTTNKTRRKSK